LMIDSGIDTDMNIGVIYPQIEYGNDPAAILTYAQTAEQLGYTHIVAYDHVLGANPDRPGGWSGPYTHKTPFHEPFVLFGFMAAVTHTIEYATGILILPQRETALVAKQAATLDILSNGRFRLGVGVGWNEVEYIALNQSFQTRGKRMDEQVPLLRRLWTEELITYQSAWHTIPDAGIRPLPQKAIPIWFGGHADAVLRRVAEMGDGWFPNYRTATDAAPHLATLNRYIEEAGRNREDIGIEARIAYGKGDTGGWRTLRDEWAEAGATHLTLNTMGSGFATPQEHLDAITRMAEVLL
jgi:probable F420-dependent oxidoreductase